MTESENELAQQIDRIDNLAAGLNMPLPPKMHLDQLKELLPEISAKMKEQFILITRKNPWK